MGKKKAPKHIPGSIGRKANGSASSAGNKHAHNRLEDLPPRVLHRIFSFVNFKPIPQSDNNPVRCLFVSKKLLPYTQPSLYSTVYIEYPYQLAAFAETIEDRPTLGNLVTTLFLGFIVCNECEPDSTSCEATDRGWPSHDDLEDLFRGLPLLTTLVVERSSRIAALVLSEEVANSESLRKLECLNFEGIFGGEERWPDALDASMYSHLQYFPALRSFTLRILDEPESDTIPVERPCFDPLSSPPPSQVTSLRIHGSFGKSSPLSLVSLFPNLTSFTFTDITPHSKPSRQNHVPLLEQLPLRLEALEVLTIVLPDYYVPLDSVLSRFKKLQTLRLSLASVTSAALPSLRHLPLRHLQLGDGAYQFSPSELLALVPTLPHLETLTLDVSSATRGHSLESWELPVWGKSLAGCLELIAGARHHGVVVRGNLIDGLEAERQFWKLLTRQQGVAPSIVSPMPLRAVGFATVPPPPTDRLSTLPPELLNHIFPLVGPIAGAISHALLPWTREQRYGTAVVKSREGLNLFARTIVVEPRLGQLVKTLVITFPSTPSGSASSPVAPALDPWTKAESARIIHLFLSLPAVKNLVLAHCPQVTPLALSSVVASRGMPELREVILQNAIPVLTLFDFNWLKHLDGFPSLSSLSILCDARLEDVLPVIPHSHARNRNVKKLSLHLPFAHQRAEDWISKFVGIEDLDLRDATAADRQHTVPTGRLLQAIYNPKLLKRLSIRWPVKPTPDRLYDELQAFENLTFVRLEGPIFDPSLLATFLRPTHPLEHLYLSQPQTSFHPASLLSLIPVRPRTTALKLITVDIPSGQRGPTMEEAGGIYVSPTGVRGMHPGWSYPNWHGTMNAESGPSMNELLAATIGVNPTSGHSHSSITPHVFIMEKKMIRRSKNAMPLPRAARAPTMRTTQLTDLPVEVLEQIWSEAPNSTRPISRLLLPMTQANLYRQIYLPSLDRISKFFGSVSQLNPGMAWRVRDLLLTLNHDSVGKTGSPADQLGQIRRLLQLLINIEDLQLRGTASLANIVLAEDFAQDSMRRLKTLEISQESDWQNTHPLSYSRYEHLSLYPELHQLEIGTHWHVTPTNLPRSEPAPFESEEWPKLNSTITKLILLGRLTSPDAVDLVAHFPRIASLILTDTSPSSNLISLLDNIPGAEVLKSLIVEEPYSVERFEPIDAALSRFENLETLHLKHEVTFSDAIFEVLAELPLKMIHFECDNLRVNLLQRLVERSETLESLHLHLPFLDGEAGATMDDWRFPRWTELFSLQGARDLQSAAVDSGLEICVQSYCEDDDDEVYQQLEDAINLEDRFDQALRPFTVAPTDSLSRLPPQVIERIFAYASDLKEPISKALLVGTEANLYHAVKLHTYEAAERFCRTIASRPRLGRLVNALTVNFGGGLDEDETENDKEDDSESETRSRAPAAVRATPTHDDLVRLFAALPLLKEVTIKYASRVADVILSRTLCTRFLRHLEWIDLRDSFDSFESPWAVRAYEHLRHFPQLFMLVLNSSEESVFVEEDVYTDENLELGVLILRGKISAPGVPNLVAHFSEIYALDLLDSSDSQDLNPIILQANHALRELVIRQSEVPKAVLPLDAALARFQHLEELQIPDDMITTSLFDSYLQDPLPLATLTIGHSMLGDNTQLSAPHLLALLRPGPGKLSALESLVIDLYPGEIGSTLEDHDGEPYTDAKGKWRMRPDWMLPAWGDHFDVEDADELVLEAQKAGVELSGSILEAIEVDHAFTLEAMVMDVRETLGPRF
ncbi:hypothetical protein RQP46_007000 [Phenoliferia psychrophenolica]